MAQWIGLVVTVAGLVVSGAVLWGVMSERVTNLKADTVRALDQSKQHYEHEANEDAHWTKREREALNKKLDEIHNELQALSRRFYGDKNNHGS